MGGSGYDALVLKVTGLNIGPGTTGCIGDIAASAQSFDANANAGTLTLTPSTNCAWFAGASQPFIQVTNGTATGSGVANFSLSANSSTGARFGVLSALGRSLHIVQSGHSAVAPFDDVPLTDPFVNHIAQMTLLAITSGCSPPSYCPGSSTTRGQMAVFIIRGF